MLLLSLFGGVLADRYSKLRIVRVTQTLLLVEATLMWWFTWTGLITVPRLLALATFAGSIGRKRPASRPAADACSPCR